MSNNPGHRTPQELLNEVVIPQLTKGMACKDNNWHGSGIMRARYTSSPTESVDHIEIETAWGEKLLLVIAPTTDLESE